MGDRGDGPCPIAASSVPLKLIGAAIWVEEPPKSSAPSSGPSSHWWPVCQSDAPPFALVAVFNRREGFAAEWQVSLMASPAHQHQIPVQSFGEVVGREQPKVPEGCLAAAVIFDAPRKRV